MEEFLNFDDKIAINIKNRNRQISKIRNSLILNNFNFNFNKEKSSSRACGDLGKGDSFINKKILKCFYTNATSLSNKLPFLETLLAMEEPDAVFISETWFK